MHLIRTVQGQGRVLRRNQDPPKFGCFTHERSNAPLAQEGCWGGDATLLSTTYESAHRATYSTSSVCLLSDAVTQQAESVSALEAPTQGRKAPVPAVQAASVVRSL